MRAGIRRHLITIQKRVATQDPGSGEVTTVWQEHAQRRSSIEPVRGREYWQAAQVQSETTHRMRMLYVPGLDPTMRIKFGDRIFRIDVVRNVEERGIEHELLVTEMTQPGGDV